MEEVTRICEEITRLIDPEKILLFGRKMTLSGEVSSFKLCIIARGNPAEIEGKIYLETDGPVSFDVLVYTPEDWETLKSENGTFANRISVSGSVLYEKKS